MGSPRSVEGPLYGYRAWKIKASGLYSFSGWRPWPEDQPKVALCWKNFVAIGGGHRAPGSGCSCGLYAWRDIPEPHNSPRGMKLIWGVVELAGTVAIHSRGYRAQYARPVAVSYSDGIEPVAERYGLIVLDDLAEWSGPPGL